MALSTLCPSSQLKRSPVVRLYTWYATIALSRSDFLEQSRALGLFRTVCRCQEFLHEDIPLKQPALHQDSNGGINHRWRTTQVGLVTGEPAVKVFLGSVVNVTTETLPVGIIFGLAQGRHVGEVVMVTIQCFKQFAVVEFCGIAGALEQYDLAIVILL